MAEYAFAQEPLSAIWDQLYVLGRAHFAEVTGVDEPNRHYDLDRDLLQAVEDVGALHIYTARVAGQLAAYVFWTVGPDAECKGLTIADMGPWYASPEHRGLGSVIWDRSVLELKKLGVKNINMHHRLHGRGARAGVFFMRRHAKPTKHEFSLWIGE
jgi:hypothetical protein